MLFRRPEVPQGRIDSTLSHRVRVSAPADEVRDAVADRDRIASWIGFGYVRDVRMDRSSVQSLTNGAAHEIRYRVVKGSSLMFHSGSITIVPEGDETEVTWTMTFGPETSLPGGVWAEVMRHMLARTLQEGLKPYVETRGNERRQTAR